MPPASSREVLAAFGPWFGLDRPTADWRPLSELLASPLPLAERAAAVRVALGGDGVPPRVATSVAQLGVVARLVAPAFGAAVLWGRLPDLSRGWWRPEIGGPMPLALADEDLLGPDCADVAENYINDILLRPVRDIVGLAGAMSVSPQVLWGNVASGLNGAAAMVGKARTDLETSAVTLATELLSRPPLSATSTRSPAGDFRRRSCCLLYRLAPTSRAQRATALCGDCVLAQV